MRPAVRRPSGRTSAMNTFINRTSKLVAVIALALSRGVFGCTFGVGATGEGAGTCADYDVGYGQSVDAYDCDVVDAWEGSTVYAHEGSVVYAHYGSLVYAYPGSTVYAESGSEVVYSY